MRDWIFSVVLTLVLTSTAVQAGWRSRVRSGDKLYEAGKHDEALVKYLQALEENGDSLLINFDLGNVFQSQEKFQEAGQAFLSSMTIQDSLKRADALYNLGNALVGGQKYSEAAEAYKSALRLHPGQMDYLHNLELALHLAQNPPPQPQSPGGKSNQEPQQQEQDSQQQEEQSPQDQQSERREQREQPRREEDLREQTEPQRAQSMSKEDAERLLNALQTDEKRVQENLRRSTGRRIEAGVEKDW